MMHQIKSNLGLSLNDFLYGHMRIFLLYGKKNISIIEINSWEINDVEKLKLCILSTAKEADPTVYKICVKISAHNSVEVCSDNVKNEPLEVVISQIILKLFENVNVIKIYSNHCKITKMLEKIAKYAI